MVEPKDRSLYYTEARDFGGLPQSGRRDWSLGILKLESMGFPNKLHVHGDEEKESKIT